MGMKTAPRFNAIALAARHLGAMSPARLLEFTLGWAITLCGTFLLMTDVGAATAALLHSFLDAIRSAMA